MDGATLFGQNHVPIDAADGATACPFRDGSLALGDTRLPVSHRSTGASGIRVQASYHREAIMAEA